MNKYSIMAIMSGVFIGFSLVIMSYVTKTVHPFVYSALSSAVATPFLLIMSFFFRGWGLGRIFSERGRDFLSVLLERFIIASGILLTFGFSMTLAIRAVFLVQLEPFFVFLWSVVLLKEKARKSKVFLLGTLILGAFLITTGGETAVFSSILAGDALIIIAMALLAHSYISSSRLMETANPLRLYFGFSVLSLPIFIALALLFLPFASFFVSPENLLLILAGVVFWNIIGFPLWLISLKHIKPWILSSSIMVQTLAGAALSYLWLGQTLSLVQLAGGAVILISVYLISLRG